MVPAHHGPAVCGNSPAPVAPVHSLTTRTGVTTARARSAREILVRPALVAGDPVRPPEADEPRFSNGVVREHPEQVDETDSLAVRASRA